MKSPIATTARSVPGKSYFSCWCAVPPNPIIWKHGLLNRNCFIGTSLLRNPRTSSCEVNEPLIIHPSKKRDPSVRNPAGCLLIVLIVPLDPSAILLVGVSQVTGQRIPRHSTSIASPHWSPQLRASTVNSTFSFVRPFSTSVPGSFHQLRPDMLC